MNIIVFGSNGMLGRYVISYLKEFNVLPISRKEYDIEKDSFEKLESIIKESNIVINCSGIIPQKENMDDISKYLSVNSVFPHNIQKICSIYSIKFIHITTDCVFDGKTGNYTESSLHTEKNIYGISKSLGEPKDACVIRTSIIGEEKTSKSLLSWVLSQDGNVINGFSNHFWNGVTCLQLSKIIKQIIEYNLYWKGIRHVFSPNSVSKYELVKSIAGVYNLKLIINEKKVEYCNKILKSDHDKIFNIPDIITQLYEQKNF